MTVEKYLKTALPLSVAGILFAGYMTGVKWFSGTCAFNESCPLLLGQPVCFYGLIIFSTMFGLTLYYMLKKSNDRCSMRRNLLLSIAGMLLSGYYAVPEMFVLLRGESEYMLGLPTCAYGLIFYIVIFVVTLVALMKTKEVVEPPVEPEASIEV